MKERRVTPQPREHFELVLGLRDGSGMIVTLAEFIPAAERSDILPLSDRGLVRHEKPTSPVYYLSIDGQFIENVR